MKNTTDIVISNSKVQVLSDGRAYIFSLDCLWAEMDNGSLVIQSSDKLIIATFARDKWDFVRRVSVNEENNL